MLKKRPHERKYDKCFQPKGENKYKKEEKKWKIICGSLRRSRGKWMERVDFFKFVKMRRKITYCHMVYTSS